MLSLPDERIFFTGVPPLSIPPPPLKCPTRLNIHFDLRLGTPLLVARIMVICKMVHISRRNVHAGLS